MALVAIVYIIQAFKNPERVHGRQPPGGRFPSGPQVHLRCAGAALFVRKASRPCRPQTGRRHHLQVSRNRQERLHQALRCRPGRHHPDRHHQGDGQSPPFRAAAQEASTFSAACIDSSIANFAPLRVPKKGDTLRLDADVPTREFLYYKHLVHQENPRTPVTVKYPALHQRRVRKQPECRRQLLGRSVRRHRFRQGQKLDLWIRSTRSSGRCRPSSPARRWRSGSCCISTTVS